jgi:hypothetical protein
MMNRRRAVLGSIRAYNIDADPRYGTEEDVVVLCGSCVSVERSRGAILAPVGGYFGPHAGLDSAECDRCGLGCPLAENA